MDHAPVAGMQERSTFAGETFVIEADKHTHSGSVCVQDSACHVSEARGCELASLEVLFELGVDRCERGVEVKVHRHEVLCDELAHEIDHVHDVENRLFVGHVLAGLLQEVALDAKAQIITESRKTFDKLFETVVLRSKVHTLAELAVANPVIVGLDADPELEHGLGVTASHGMAEHGNLVVVDVADPRLQAGAGQVRAVVLGLGDQVQQGDLVERAFIQNASLVGDNELVDFAQARRHVRMREHVPCLVHDASEVDLPQRGCTRQTTEGTTVEHTWECAVHDEEHEPFDRLLEPEHDRFVDRALVVVVVVLASLLCVAQNRPA